MKRYWFKAKSYGWGWYPATWEGWVTLLIYVILITTNFFRINPLTHSAGETFMDFLPESLIATIILIIICYKTGEKPGWRWGNKKKKS